VRKNLVEDHADALVVDPVALDESEIRGEHFEALRVPAHADLPVQDLKALQNDERRVARVRADDELAPRILDHRQEPRPAPEVLDRVEDVPRVRNARRDFRRPGRDLAVD
jgi:hypothetical protein